MRPIPFFLTILVLGLIQVASAISSATAQSALKVHNEYRAKHGVPALKWSTKLEKYAQSWSNQCNFKHTGGPYGENLAWGYSNFPAAIAAWYNEEKQYNYNKPGFSSATGHFTAMVWKSTTEVGCGIKTCSNGAKMYTCSYAPAGNIVGNNNAYFKANVLPPK
ncbi:CAP domain-containing protein [Fennellomyces sp. T-0311]|nr:CAP domain-containing protein [Fennellomyces sp. T-0311]